MTPGGIKTPIKALVELGGMGRSTQIYLINNAIAKAIANTLLANSTDWSTKLFQSLFNDLDNLIKLFFLIFDCFLS